MYSENQFIPTPERHINMQSFTKAHCNNNTARSYTMVAKTVKDIQLVRESHRNKHGWPKKSTRSDGP